MLLRLQQKCPPPIRRGFSCQNKCFSSLQVAKPSHSSMSFQNNSSFGSSSYTIISLIFLEARLLALLTSLEKSLDAGIARTKDIHFPATGPRSAVGNASGYRCEADCRSRGCEFDPGPVPYFRGDLS